ncbi:MAG: hypothetical protein AAGG01_04875 [Planctomycetota bacterium]
MLPAALAFVRSLAARSLRTGWLALLALVTAASALAQDLPLRFQGDGMTIVVTELSEPAGGAAGQVVGTVRLPGAAKALPFTLDLTEREDGCQVGKGKVQSDTIARRISTRENEDGSIRVTYRAKRYVVSLAAAGERGVNGQEEEPRAVAGPRASTSTLGTIRLKRHTFNDAKWRGRPSHSMLVPQGWEVKGGAFWAPPVFFQVMPSQEIEVTSPEGHSLRIEPSIIAKDFTPPAQLGMPRPKEWASDNGFPIVYMPLGLPEWKRWMQEKVIPSTYKDARNIQVTEARIVPELTAIMVKQYEPMRQLVMGNAAMDATIGQRSSFDCWILGFTSTYEIGGKPFEELRLVAVSAMTSDSQLMGRSIMWTTDRSFSFRAPAGELEQTMPLFSTLANSLRMTQPWMNMKADLFAKIMKGNREAALANMKATAQRSAILSKTYSEISDITHNGYRDREAIRDAGQASLVRSIREVDVYSVPGSSTAVELPSGYDHVYSNGNDEYLLTNDALFNPNVDLTTSGSWSTMRTAGR